MAELPLYDQARSDAKPSDDGHFGLWWERFFNGYPNGWKHDISDPSRKEVVRKEWATNKESWLRQFDGKKVGLERDLKAACERQKALCEHMNGEARTFSMTWHFATGLGLPHPMENGFLWHPTLGTPYLPGSAVKGLVRSWVEEWEDPPETDAGRKERLARLYRWFGSEAKDPKDRRAERATGFVPPTKGTRADQDTEAGGFIFFDALPTMNPILKADVMTPHMDKWYEAGANRPGEADTTPADWHDPRPVQFLVVDKPEFQFAIAPRTEEAKGELQEVLDALTYALEWLGTGAKTAVGYGQGVISENRAKGYTP